MAICLTVRRSSIVHVMLFGLLTAAVQVYWMDAQKLTEQHQSQNG